MSPDVASPRAVRSSSVVRAVRIALVALWVATLSGAHARADEIIERVMAVAAGDVITLSDIRAAQTLGLVKPAEGVEPTRSVLSQLIDRALILDEVNRYAPPEPSEQAIDASVGDVRARVGSSTDLESALLRVGLTEQQLREHLRDDLRIRAYLAQRFAADTPEHSQTAVGEWVNGLRRRADIVDLYTSDQAR